MKRDGYPLPTHPPPDSVNTNGRTFSGQTVLRKLRFHGIDTVTVVMLETAGKLVDTGEGEGDLRQLYLLPGWWEWAVAYDSEQRLLNDN